MRNSSAIFLRFFFYTAQSNAGQALITLTPSSSITNDRGARTSFSCRILLSVKGKDFWELPCQHELFYHRLAPTCTFPFQQRPLLPNVSLATRDSSNVTPGCWSVSVMSSLNYTLTLLYTLTWCPLTTRLNTVQEVPGTDGFLKYI